MRFSVIPITILLLTIGASSAFPAASEDAQVIPSKTSVLVIYDYGKTANSEPGPDFSISRSVPTTTSSTPAATPEPLKSGAAGSPLDPAPLSSAGTSKSSPTSANELPALDPVPIPDPIVFPRLITLLWNPSPDQSVAGYALYSGTATQQYSARQTLGNQTSVSVVLDQSIMYFAVTAYTAEGLESIPSEELVVNGNLPSRNRPVSDLPDSSASKL